MAGAESPLSLKITYGGEPFKLTAIDCGGRRIIIGWTRANYSDAMHHGRAIIERDGLTDLHYQQVRNRKTGDDATH